MTEAVNIFNYWRRIRAGQMIKKKKSPQKKQAGQLIICPKCKKEVQKNTSYCPICGEKI